MVRKYWNLRQKQHRHNQKERSTTGQHLDHGWYVLKLQEDINYISLYWATCFRHWKCIWRNISLFQVGGPKFCKFSPNKILLGIKKGGVGYAKIRPIWPKMENDKGIFIGRWGGGGVSIHSHLMKGWFHQNLPKCGRVVWLPPGTRC